MKRIALAAAAGALVMSSFASSMALAQERRSDDGEKKDNTAAIVAGVAALGLGIAIATSKHGDENKYDTQWDGNLYGQPFSPARGVTCIPRQRACYDRNNYSYSWTKRIFGTSAGFGGSGGSWEDGGFGGSGGSWGGGNQNLDYARRVCIDRGEQRGLRNIYVTSVKPEGSNRARVYMDTRRSPATVNVERWRCEYRFESGRTDFKRI